MKKLFLNNGLFVAKSTPILSNTIARSVNFLVFLSGWFSEEK